MIVFMVVDVTKLILSIILVTYFSPCEHLGQLFHCLKKCREKFRKCEELTSQIFFLFFFQLILHDENDKDNE